MASSPSAIEPKQKKVRELAVPNYALQQLTFSQHLQHLLDQVTPHKSDEMRGPAPTPGTGGASEPKHLGEVDAGPAATGYEAATTSGCARRPKRRADVQCPGKAHAEAVKSYAETLRAAYEGLGNESGEQSCVQHRALTAKSHMRSHLCGRPQGRCLRYFRLR